MATRTVSAAGGNYSATTAWVEAAVPTAADDIVCLAAGASGPLTIDVNSAARSADFTNYTNTLTHASGVTWTLGTSTTNASLSLKLVAGMTYTLGSVTTSLITFASTSGTQEQITSAGKTLPGLTFSGAGGSWKFADSSTVTNTAQGVNHQAGTLDTGNFNHTWWCYNSNSSTTRVFNGGTSTLTLTSTNGTPGTQGVSWDNATTATNGTWNTSSMSITMATTTSGYIRTAGLTLNVVTWSGFTGTVQMGNVTCTTLSVTGGVGKSAAIFNQGSAVAGWTVTGTLTLGGDSATHRLLVQGGTVGSQRTITAGSLACSNGVDFQDIKGAGTATWSAAASGASAFGDCQGNSGITFDAPVTQTYTDTGVHSDNWSTLARWTSRVPLPQDNVLIPLGSTGTITADMPRLGANVDFTGFTGGWTPGAVTVTIFGNLTMASGMTMASANTVQVSGRGAQTFTSAGFSGWTGALTFNAPNGTYTLADALSCAAHTLNLNNGTLDAATNNVDVTVLQFSQTAGTLNMGTGTWTLATPTVGANAWIVTGGTVNASTSTIRFSNTATGTRNFQGGGKAYGTLTYTVAGSTGALVITGANSFDTINFSDVTNARTLTLPASTITTVRNSLNVNGTSGKVMTVASSTPGTQATLAKSGGGFASTDFVSVQDIKLSVGNWFAGAHSTNVSDNTGVTFTAAPAAQPQQQLMSMGVG